MKKSKKFLREIQSKDSDGCVHLTCCKCKRKIKTRTTTPEIYTKKVMDNYVCLLCK